MNNILQKITRFLGITHQESEIVSDISRIHTNNTEYFRKWLILGILIGGITGVGIAFFTTLENIFTHIFLEIGAGYTPPLPDGEGTTIITPIARLWFFPIATTIGGLLSGVITTYFTDKSEAQGADNVIRAFHFNKGKIKMRDTILRPFAATILIGSGGSAGPESPVAQVAAGFGSAIATWLHMDDRDRRIALAAGVGSGIGAIFKTPFGGALLGAELLYQHDFESEAIFPSFVASVVAYTIYGEIYGFTPIFGVGKGYSFVSPISLVAFAILGLVAGGIGLLYTKLFFFTHKIFKKLRIPTVLKPAIGGLLVGCIGIFFPQIIGVGYGWSQLGINNNFTDLGYGWMQQILNYNYAIFFIFLMLSLIFLKIIATSLSVGSGGSGGVFAPGLVIGGYAGAFVWGALHVILPQSVGAPGAYMVVGMGALFGAIANAPIAVILMVVEMTHEYTLLAPTMLAASLAMFVTRGNSIFKEQLPTRLDSPAHKSEYIIPLLQNIRIANVMDKAPVKVGLKTPYVAILDLLKNKQVKIIYVVDKDELKGIITMSNITKIRKNNVSHLVAEDFMTTDVITTTPQNALYNAWAVITQNGFRSLPVVSEQNGKKKLQGIITLQGIGASLKLPILEEEQRQISEDPSQNFAESSQNLAVETINPATADSL